MNAPVQKINGYYVQKELGNGAFGKVYLVEKGEQQFAMKRIKIQANMEGAVQREVELHAGHNHPNIVKCVDYFFTTDGSNRYCYMVNEFCNRGTLESYLEQGPIPRNLLLKWIKELLEAITYIHKASVIHRDIKPENILIAGDTIKIGDLGIAAILPNEKGISTEGLSLANMPKEYHSTFMGNASTLLYMAPELFLNKYRRRADIFSLGLIFHTMVTRSVVEVDGVKYYGSCLQNDFIGQCIAKHVEANTLSHLSAESLFSHPNWNDDIGRKISSLVARMLIISKDERAAGPELLNIYDMLFSPNLPTNVAPKGNLCTLL